MTTRILLLLCLGIAWIGPGGIVWAEETDYDNVDEYDFTEVNQAWQRGLDDLESSLEDLRQKNAEIAAENELLRMRIDEARGQSEKLEKERSAAKTTQKDILLWEVKKKPTVPDELRRLTETVELLRKERVVLEEQTLDELKERKDLIENKSRLQSKIAELERRKKSDASTRHRQAQLDSKEYQNLKTYYY